MCNQEKPLSEFYICGGIPQSRCKLCKKNDADALKLYGTFILQPYAAWSPELQKLTMYFVDCQANGGKLNYKRSVAQELVDRYNITTNGVEETENINPIEAIIQLRETVARLEKVVVELQEQISNAKESATTLKGQQERRNLLSKIQNDPQMVEILGSVEDVNEFCAKLLDAARKVYKQGYLPGGDLRQILVEFESVQEPFTEDILIFYRQFLYGGIQKAKLHDDYADNVELVESLLGYNAYEIDWSEVPVSS